MRRWTELHFNQVPLEDWSDDELGYHALNRSLIEFGPYGYVGNANMAAHLAAEEGSGYPSWLRDQYPRFKALQRRRTIRRRNDRVERGAKALVLRARGSTLREIGVELGVTTERARQIVSQAFDNEQSYLLFVFSEIATSAHEAVR